MLRRYAPSQSPAGNPIKPLVSLKTPESADDGKRKRKSTNTPITSIAKIDHLEFASPYRMMCIDTAKADLVAMAASNEHEKFLQDLLNKPYKCPMEGYICGNSTRTLGMRRSNVKRAMFDPYAENALVLYTPPELSAQEELKIKEKDKKVHVVVDPRLTQVLRPHQREGVKFMYDCVTGKQVDGFNGCLMADEMGLGKTLQCIALMWTLMRQGPDTKPEINKAIIVCPSSLVKNWDKEIAKWLKGSCNSQAIDSGKKEDIIKKLTAFMDQVGTRAATPVIIISYETFRLYINILHAKEIGLVICDEGHRLKNSENQTYQALNQLKCKRRILISGTPIQNDLLEYYSLVNFVNPNMLGDAATFKKTFENPIIKGRDADATDEQQKRGDEKLKEMSELVNKCIIRRTSALLTKYLPVKYELILCCKLTELQESLYRELIKRNKENILKTQDAKKSGEKAEGGAMTGTTLSFITNLKKLCNHPTLIHEKCLKQEPGFESCLSLFPSTFSSTTLNVEFSGKMKVLDYLLAFTKKTTKDKFVLISNYTQTMDAFVDLCNARKYKFVRLDGTMSIKNRGKIVEKFNDLESEEYIFLLSSKAGGCGLNLIGANRLVMFDPDWNPANDDQAMARVWRDGQKKTCFIYRLLVTGSIEEKIFQRQTHKKALSSCVVDAQVAERHFSIGDLRTLFELKTNIASDTHDKLKCKRCISGVESVEPPLDADTNSDVSKWFHSQNNARKIPDNVLKNIWSSGVISFAFHQKSHEQTAEMKQKLKEEEEDAKDENYNPEKDYVSD